METKQNGTIKLCILIYRNILFLGERCDIAFLCLMNKKGQPCVVGIFEGNPLEYIGVPKKTCKEINVIEVLEQGSGEIKIPPISMLKNKFAF